MAADINGIIAKYNGLPKEITLAFKASDREQIKAVADFMRDDVADLLDRIRDGLLICQHYAGDTYVDEIRDALNGLGTPEHFKWQS